MSAISTIRHIGLPGYSNNFKARVLQVEGLLVVTLFIFLLQSLMNFSLAARIGVLGYAANISVDEVISLTNQKRLESGLEELAYSSALAEAAKAKGEDMLNKDYWAHVAPDGTEPWDFFLDFGYKYRYAGENLARDFSNPTNVVEAWMASSSHKENLLSPKYDEIGVAVVEGDLSGADTTIIVQLFGNRSSSALVPVAAAEDENPALKVTEEQEAVVENKAVAVTENNPLENTLSAVSPFDVTRFVSFSTVGLMLGVLIIDLIEIRRKGIQRVSSKTFAHFSFMIMILIIIIVVQAGKVI